MALPDAIRKMTSFPAQRLGLPDRGLLRDGFKADVVVFDPHTVKAPATRTQPKQFPIGIDYVIVNGKVVVDQGGTPASWPGRALRRGAPRRRRPAESLDTSHRLLEPASAWDGRPPAARWSMPTPSAGARAVRAECSQISQWSAGRAHHASTNRTA